MSAVEQSAVVYKIKFIDFLRRKVPVVMQNENGPCPLLALANVLLLRKQIFLPQHTTDVSQERLVSLVAGYLLDANNDERLMNADEDYKANLRQNIADAITLLPKLATGLDVNVKFQDIQGFEFTQETAIFDLLDIRLVHGWLYDPQDTRCCQAIGQRSYNELVSLLVSTLGDETPTHLLSPNAVAAHNQGIGFSRHPSYGGRAPASTTRSVPPASPTEQGVEGNALDADDPGEQQLQNTGPHPQNPQQLPGLLSNPTANAAAARSLPPAAEESSLVANDALELQQALALSVTQSGNKNGTTDPASTTGSQRQDPGASSASEETSASCATPLMRTVNDNVKLGSAHSSRPDFSAPEGAAARQALGEGELIADDWVKVSTGRERAELCEEHEKPAVQGERCSYSQQHASSSGTSNPVPENPRSALNGVPPMYDDVALAKGKMPAFIDVDPEEHHRADAEESASEAATLPSSMAKMMSHQGYERRAEEVDRTNAIQDFLEQSSSQLTEHGLFSLQQGLRQNELGILFRNNHFNTIFAHADSIWILVTDQGYLFEESVVWERLCDVNGNTEFAKSDFAIFTGHPPSREVAAAAELAQAAFSSVVAPKDQLDEPGKADPDADMALAFQLQEEENARQQQFLAQQQDTQHSNHGRKPLNGASLQRKPVAPGRQSKTKNSWKQGANPAKKKDEKCSIM